MPGGFPYYYPVYYTVQPAGLSRKTEKREGVKYFAERKCLETLYQFPAGLVVMYALEWELWALGLKPILDIPAALAIIMTMLYSFLAFLVAGAAWF